MLLGGQAHVSCRLLGPALESTEGLADPGEGLVVERLWLGVGSHEHDLAGLLKSAPGNPDI